MGGRPAAAAVRRRRGGAWRAERDALRAERRRPVSRRASQLGLLALAPLLLTFGTGIAIYTFNLRGDRPSSLHIWVHTGAAVLALLLVTVKVARLGWRHIRREVSRRSRSGRSAR